MDPDARLPMTPDGLLMLAADGTACCALGIVTGDNHEDGHVDRSQREARLLLSVPGLGGDERTGAEMPIGTGPRRRPERTLVTRPSSWLTGGSMMPGRTRLLRLLAIPALAASVAMVPAASTQGWSSQPECSLLTREEVAKAFAVSDVHLEDLSWAFECSFVGEAELRASIWRGTDLADTRAHVPAGVDLTVAGLPAWFSPGERSLWVDAGGQLLYLSAFSSTAEALTEEGILAALTALAGVALPRLPAGPSEEDIARMEAVIPDTIGDEAVSVQILPFVQVAGRLDEESPDFMALLDALAAQGKSTADVFFAVGSADPDGDPGITVVLVRGADASSLLLPLSNAGFWGGSGGEVTTAEIGGKQVTVIGGKQGTVTATDPVWHAYATGDLAIYALGPDEFLQGYFALLP